MKDLWKEGEKKALVTCSNCIVDTSEIVFAFAQVGKENVGPFGEKIFEEYTLKLCTLFRLSGKGKCRSI